MKSTTEDFCPNIADDSINEHMEKYKDIICTVPRCDKLMERIACSTTFITHLDVKTKIKDIKKVNDTLVVPKSRDFNPDYDTIVGPIQKSIICSMKVCTRAR